MYIGTKGYIMFGDRWITENDKILYNQLGEVFTVLDYKVIEEQTLLIPELMPHHSTWYYKKFSCVKLDKEVKITDKFYTTK